MKEERSNKLSTTDLSSLHDSQILYVKRIEKENLDRVLRLQKLRRNNLMTGLGLAGSVLGICILFKFIIPSRCNILGIKQFNVMIIMVFCKACTISHSLIFLFHSFSLCTSIQGFCSVWLRTKKRKKMKNRSIRILLLYIVVTLMIC